MTDTAKPAGIGLVECAGIVEDVLGTTAVTGVLTARSDEDAAMWDREVDSSSEWDLFALANSACSRANCTKQQCRFNVGRRTALGNLHMG